MRLSAEALAHTCKAVGAVWVHWAKTVWAQSWRLMRIGWMTECTQRPELCWRLPSHPVALQAPAHRQQSFSHASLQAAGLLLVVLPYQGVCSGLVPHPSQ